MVTVLSARPGSGHGPPTRAAKGKGEARGNGITITFLTFITARFVHEERDEELKPERDEQRHVVLRGHGQRPI